MKPRLLFLAQTLPYPPTGGVKIRTFNTLRILSATFDVTALCFYRWKSGLLEPDIDDATRQLQRLATVRAFPIPSDHSPWRTAWDHLRSLVTGRVYTRFTYESRDFENCLRGVLREREFDMVHADSLDLAGYFDLVPRGVPIACVHHDAQSVLLKRRAGRERRPWVAGYLRHQASLMRREERATCASVDVNIAVSDNDAEALSDIAPGARFVVVPNGVDVEFFRPTTSEPSDSLCFVGGTTWFPNRDALEFYAREILPEIRRRLKVETMWIGRASDEELRRHEGTPGLSLTGFVPDIRPYVAAAACFVVPLRVGGGTRIKILDAWAMGKAVVSTSLGCEGLAAVDGQNILIADSPARFADAVARVVTDYDLRRQLEEGARRTVEDRYSWEVVGERLVQEYRRLLASDHN